MPAFHSRTLDILTESGITVSRTPCTELLDWAEKEGVSLPQAFLEWAEFDPTGSILSRFSNCDSFNWMKVASLPDGRKGLFFHTENQGNFDAVCLLDEGDDPPVIFLWVYGQWVESCSKFSDYIFTQVFDWQHKLEFDENGNALYLKHREISLKSAKALELLTNYQEKPSNAWVVDDAIMQARRFQSKSNARATAQYQSVSFSEISISGAKCIIQITASEDDAAIAFEAELLNLLSDFLVAPIFHCPHNPKTMMRSLDYLISKELRSQIKFISSIPLADHIVDLIIRSGQETPFEKRVEETFRDKGEPPLEEWIGGSDWNIRMKLVRVKHGWIRIDRIEIARENISNDSNEVNSYQKKSL